MIRETAALDMIVKLVMGNVFLKKFRILREQQPHRGAILFQDRHIQLIGQLPADHCQRFALFLRHSGQFHPVQ